MKALIFKTAPYLFWLCFAFVTVLLLMELPPKTGGWPYWDKVYHVIIFAGLTGLGMLAYRNKALLLSVSLAIYGGLAEVLQGQLTVTRMPSLLDWAADLVGILLALILFRFVRYCFQKESA